MVSGTLIKQHVTGPAYVICLSQAGILIPWTNVCSVDFDGDWLFIVTLSSLEDPVLDVSIKTLVLSSEFLGLIVWFSPTSLGSILIMWCLVILYPWIHQCVFSKELFVVCDAFSYSFASWLHIKVIGICLSMWGLAILANNQPLPSNMGASVDLCASFWMLAQSSFGCCLLICSKLGHKIVLAVNIIISEFLYDGHSLPVFGLYCSTAV